MAELSMPPVHSDGPWSPTIVEHRLSPTALYAACRDLMPAYACMEISADRKTCTIYLPRDPPPWTVEHERLHCRGYMHYPGTVLLFDPTLPHNAGRVTDLLRFYRRMPRWIAAGR